MNHQFIQSVLFDWDKISDESYLTRIEALYKVKKIDFMKPITLFVGENGSGKSTLAKLAARFWDFQEGDITIGGVDIKTIEPETLLKNISVVFQDVIFAFRRMTRTRTSAML